MSTSNNYRMDESEFDLDDGGWSGTTPRTPSMLSWRSDPLESHSDWKVRVKSTNANGEDVTYHLHKVVLSCGEQASGYFHAQFSQSTIESETSTTVLDLPSECASCMQNLLDFVYDGSIQLDADTALPMFELARRLDIPALGKECMDWIKAKLVSADTQFALKAFLQGLELHLEKVSAASLKVVARGFTSINQETLLCVPIEHIVQLLQLDELNAPEDQVFDFIVTYNDSQTLSEADRRKLWLCCRFAHLSIDKRVEALGQESLPREAFFEDIIALVCMQSHAVGANRELDGLSPECKQRMKRRKTHYELTVNSELTVQGDTLVQGPSDLPGLRFKVLPECSPTASQSMQHTNPFQIPQGWQVVSTSDVDFDTIRTRVIAQHPWKTALMHVRNGDGFKAFYCKGTQTPGDEYGFPFLQENGNNFQFIDCCGTLLIRNSTL